MKLKKEVKIGIAAILAVVVLALIVFATLRLNRPEGSGLGLAKPRIQKPESKPEVKPEPDPEPEVEPEPEPEPVPEEKPESSHGIVSNPESVTMLVNKELYMSPSFVPSLATFPEGYAVSYGYEARPAVVDAYRLMVDTMEAETGLWMYVTSAYRGYDYQKELYDGYVASHGEAEAKRMVAYPGTSEHQTGLVVDVVTPGGNMFSFGDTEQSTWVNANAHRFGFVIRYEPQFEDITGYMAEAWHLRYLGVDVATAVYNSGRPFDEYHAKYLE